MMREYDWYIIFMPNESTFHYAKILRGVELDFEHMSEFGSSTSFNAVITVLRNDNSMVGIHPAKRQRIVFHRGRIDLNVYPDWKLPERPLQPGMIILEDIMDEDELATIRLSL